MQGGNDWVKFVPVALILCWCEHWLENFPFGLHLKHRICSLLITSFPETIMVGLYIPWSQAPTPIGCEILYDLLKWTQHLPNHIPLPPLYQFLLRYILVRSVYIGCTFFGHYSPPILVCFSSYFLVVPYMMGWACYRYADDLNSSIAYIFFCRSLYLRL